MTPAEDYRVKAAKLHASAGQEENRSLRDELEKLARSYLRLAEQADRNATTDLVYEVTERKSP